MVRVLLTRPEPAATHFSQAIEARCGAIDVLISPVMSLAATNAAPPDVTPNGLVVTSTAAVPHLGPFADLPAFVVGQKTAQALKDRGVTVLQVAEDARQLVASLPDTLTGPLLYLRGSHVAVAVVEMLDQRGLACVEWIVYEQVPQPLTAAALSALTDDEAIVLPLFSPRSAELTLAQMSSMERKAPLVIVTMSAAVEEVCAMAPNVERVRSAQPTGTAMLDAIEVALKRARLLEGDQPVP